MADDKKLSNESKNIVERGKKVIDDGKRALEDGKRAIEDGKRIIEDGKKVVKKTFFAILLYYTMVGLAAFFVVAYSLISIFAWIGNWWEERRDDRRTPVYSEVVASDAANKPVQKVSPIVDAAELTPRVSGPDGQTQDRRYLVIPTRLKTAQGAINPHDSDEIIVTGAKRGALPDGLSLPAPADRARDKDGNIDDKNRHAVQRSCSGANYTNLLLHDRQSGTTSPIFTAPLAIVAYQIITTDNQTSHILANTALLDTNQDDTLTCKDFLRMAIYDVATQELSWVDMGNSEAVPIQTNYYGHMDYDRDTIQISDTDYLFGVGIDENRDGLFDPLQEIVEIAVLNVEDKTVKKIVSAGDLANVQNILYQAPD